MLLPAMGHRALVVTAAPSRLSGKCEGITGLASTSIIMRGERQRQPLSLCHRQ